MVLRDSIKNENIEKGEDLFEFKARFLATFVQFVVVDGGCSSTSDVVEPFYFQKPDEKFNKAVKRSDLQQGASGPADASASGPAEEDGASGDAAAASGPAEEPAADASGPAEEPAADATAAEAGASGAAAFRFRGAAVQQARLVEANDW